MDILNQRPPPLVRDTYFGDTGKLQNICKKDYDRIIKNIKLFFRYQIAIHCRCSHLQEEDLPRFNGGLSVSQKMFYNLERILIQNVSLVF